MFRIFCGGWPHFEVSFLQARVVIRGLACRSGLVAQALASIGATRRLAAFLSVANARA